MSGQIKRLEDEVGARLFERTTRQVRMTEAGIRVMPHIRSVLSQAKQVAMKARIEDIKTPASIIIGDESAAFSDGTARKLMSQVPKHTALNLRVRPVPGKGWVAGLISGSADVVFLNRPPKGQLQIEYEMVSHCPLVCAMQNQHLLERAPIVTPALLKDDSIIVPTENRIGSARQSLKSIFQIEPTVELIDADQDWATIIEMVRCGMALAMVPETLRDVAGEALTFRSLENGPSLTHYMAWRNDESREHVEQFIELILASQAIANG